MRTAKRYGRKAETALDLWVKLTRAFATFDKFSTESIRSFGLTPAQFSVLECLGHLGPMTIGALSKKMLFSGGNTTCVMDNLEKDGLVERTHDKEDRRVVNVRLSAKGTALFENIFAMHAAHIAKIASVLSAEEQEALAGLLKKLGRSLQAAGCPAVAPPDGEK